jgi:DNA-binding transcriptional LysR family regulator
MDTHRLRYFVSVARTGSLSKAAELFRISPPALTKSMRVLQDELGVKLFETSGRNLILTDAGKKLAVEAERIIRELERLRSQLQTGETRDREIRIATFEVFSTYFLSFLKHVPWEKTPIVLHEVLPGELERYLRDGHVDIGITYMPVPLPEVSYYKVTSIPMGVFTSKTAFPNVKQSDLPFVVPVMPVTGSPTRIRGLDGWPDDAYPRKVRFQVTLMESALELCRQGRAAGYFPQFIVQEHNDRVKDSLRLVRRMSPYPGRTCSTDVFIVRRKGDGEDARSKQLAKGIRMVCRSQ